MNRILKTLVVASLCLFYSCQDYGVELRLRNTSEVDFDNILVNNISFGPLSANETSDYMPFENIYSSEFIQVEIGDQVLKLIPDTFNKDDFYATGKFRFDVDIAYSKWLIVALQEE